MQLRRLFSAVLPFFISAIALHAQGTITSLQSGPLGGNLPTNADAITAGGNVSGNGFTMYVQGSFNSDTFANVTIFNPATNQTLVCDSSCVTEAFGSVITLDIPGTFYPDTGSVYQLQVTEYEFTSGSDIPAPSNTVPFTVNPNLAGPSSLILPPGTTGVPYSQTLFTGGTAPVRVSLTQSSGPIPPGLQLPQQNNLISGIPNTAGNYSFSTFLTDAWGNTLTLNELIQIFNVPILTSPAVPASVGVGTNTVLVTLNGANFAPPLTGLSTTLPGTQIVVNASRTNGQTITPTFISPTQLQVALPGAFLQSVQTLTLTALQPSGVSSSPVQFSVLAPVVTSPAAGSTILRPTILTVNGANFVANGITIQSQIVLNGTPVATTVVDSGTLTTSATLLAGRNTVSVTNPGGTTSNSVTFQVITALQITTTSLPQGSVGAPYNASLGAAGGTTPYAWSATGLPSGLSINAQTGTISGTPLTAGSFTVNVTVRDSSDSPGTATARLSLSIVQQQTPISFTTTLLPDATAQVPYSTSLGATGGTGSGYTFAVAGALPPGLALSPGGVLSGTPTTAGAFNFSVTVTDNGGNSTSQGFNLNVKPAALVITTTGPFAPVTAGTPVSLKFGASGGLQPYTFSATGLPAGVSVASDGTLSGSASQPGTFTFTVTVKDRVGTSASASFALTVTGAPLGLTGSLGNGVVGSSYNGSVTGTGGKTPYTYSATGVPDGLSFAGGALTGTPTTAGTFSVVVTVTDAANAKVTQTFTVTIATAPLTITGTLPNGSIAAAYSATLTASGGTAPYTFTFSGLPAGLTGDASGAVSGTPTTAGASTVTATVTDAKKQTATQTFTVTIAAAPLTIAPASLANATAGAAYSATFTAAGGFGPYTFTATGLPTGLSLSTGGALSGTIASPGSASITVTVKDSTGATTSKTYALTTVLPALPAVSLTGLPGTGNPASQSTLQIGLGSAFPVAVTVNLTLTFAPDSGPDDPAVQFASGGRTAQLTIPAGSTVSPAGVALQTGTVAGLITVTARFVAGTQDVTPSPAPTATIRINAAAPTISTATATLSGSTLTVTITGFATSRSVTQATFVFTAAAGSNPASTTVTVPVTALFSTWYGSAASAPFGGQFSFSQTFNISGGSITSVTVTLTNATGTSAAVTATVH